MNDSQATQLSQKIEKEVRQLIGDLHMQVLILRQMMELQQQHPQEQPKPQPIPPQPEQPPPEKKEPGERPAERRSNGHYQEKIVP